MWTGGIGNGSPIIKIDGKNRRAHRVAYELTKGPIPEGVRILQKCKQPLCVRHVDMTISMTYMLTASRERLGKMYLEPRDVCKLVNAESWGHLVAEGGAS